MTSTIIHMTAAQHDNLVKLSRKTDMSFDQIVACILTMGMNNYSNFIAHNFITGKNVYHMVELPIRTCDSLLSFLQLHYEEDVEQLYRRVVEYGMVMYSIITN